MISGQHLITYLQQFCIIFSLESCLCQDTSGGCTTPEWRALCGNPLYREFLKETCPKTCG